jgi:hypothetical protein
MLINIMGLGPYPNYLFLAFADFSREEKWRIRDSERRS